MWHLVKNWDMVFKIRDQANGHTIMVSEMSIKLYQYNKVIMTGP